MEAGQKHYPASEQKLRRLCEQGIAAQSRNLNTPFLILGVLIGLLMSSMVLIDQGQKLSSAAFSGSLLETKNLLNDDTHEKGLVTGSLQILIKAQELYGEGITALLSFLLFLFLPPVIMIWLVNGYQVGFSFRANRDVTRGQISGANQRLGSSKRLSGFTYLLNAFFWFGILALVYYNLLSSFAMDYSRLKFPKINSFSQTELGATDFDIVKLKNDSNFLMTKPLRVISLLLGISFLWGLLSYMVVVISFRFGQQMSREEVEAESREEEMSAELRQAQREVLRESGMEHSVGG